MSEDIVLRLDRMCLRHEDMEVAHLIAEAANVISNLRKQVLRWQNIALYGGDEDDE